jgi:hypothetical protein
LLQDDKFLKNTNFFQKIKYRDFFCPLIRGQMDYKKSPKIAEKFYCEKCDYKCSKQSDYSKHILTRKHQKTEKRITEDYKKSPKIAEKNFVCECGKSYLHRQGLWKHKKTCQHTFFFKKEDSKDKDELINYLIKENSELKNMVLDVCKNMQTINFNTNTNSYNKTFNLQIFLNEQCKDAMNIMDFVESLKIQLTDLENVGKVGFIDGISNIIIKNLKALEITQRPVHCSDSKREILYIKDEDKWEKENEEKMRLKKAIKYIANKNCKLISEWKEKYPECIYSHSKKSDEYNKIILESMGGGQEDINENKIIKKIAKEVLIDK